MKLKDLIPPLVYDWLYTSRMRTYGWFGDYSSWDDAMRDCTGYDSSVIIQKVTSSLLKVKNGEAVYERDSVIFDRIEYSWPVLSGLLYTAAFQKGELNVLDFGGSLGSSYFQNHKFLKDLPKIKWNIVEQEKFVTIGKAHFQDKNLKFYFSINDYLSENKPDVVLLSSVLPYLEKPFKTLSDIINIKAPFIILDKMPFITRDNDRLTIQKTPPHIYEAKYPAWFFNEKKIKEVLCKNYKIIEEFEPPAKTNIPSYFKGFILQLTN